MEGEEGERETKRHGFLTGGGVEKEDDSLLGDGEGDRYGFLIGEGDWSVIEEDGDREGFLTGEGDWSWIEEEGDREDFLTEEGDWPWIEEGDCSLIGEKDVDRGIFLLGEKEDNKRETDRFFTGIWEDDTLFNREEGGIPISFTGEGEIDELSIESDDDSFVGDGVLLDKCGRICFITGEGVGDGDGEGNLICIGKGDCLFVDDDDCIGDDKTGGVVIEDEEGEGVVVDDKEGDGVLICKGDNERSPVFDEELCCEHIVESNRVVWSTWLEDWGGFRIASASVRIESVPFCVDTFWLWRKFSNNWRTRRVFTRSSSSVKPTVFNAEGIDTLKSADKVLRSWRMVLLIRWDLLFIFSISW